MPAVWKLCCAACSAFGGYFAGLAATIIVMNVFQVRRLLAL